MTKGPATRRPNPVLYQVNVRVRLSSLSRELSRPATLDDVPDSSLDAWAATGFDWIWLYGVWDTGTAGTAGARARPEWRDEFLQALPDLTEDDICAPNHAVAAYSVPEEQGGDEALARLRERLRKRGLLLMLDFVANHTALDHPWVKDHPDYYVSGDEDDLAAHPGDWTRLPGGEGGLVLAHGRNPDFPGWTATLQLDYGNPEVPAAMTDLLAQVAQRCDGIRCDMAMLLLPEVFERTWGRPSVGFWPQALAAVREQRPESVFLAEVYWDLEWRLQEDGFDYTYDKGLYDRLRLEEADGVRRHLHADALYQRRLARFLENHAEPRAAAAFTLPVHQAAAAITYLSPGLRFFHQGQLEGHRIRVSPLLCRGPAEPDDPELRDFYRRLLACLGHPAARMGAWNLLECRPAWDDNNSWQAFVCATWSHPAFGILVVAVNYAPHPGQCYLQLPYPHLAGSRLHLRDLLGTVEYHRDADAVIGEGLYLDVPAWGHHVFAVEVA